MGDWFRDIVRAAFGSWDPVAQYRYIDEIFALVGKKNSKTTNGAGLGVTWLLLNERPRASGILVAPTQDIADLSYSQAEGMVRLDPGLINKRIRVQNHQKTLTNLKTGATLEVLTFDPAILTGVRAAFWLLDEEHVVARSAKAASALGQIRGGMISIPEALGIIITTQSDAQPVGVFKADLKAARDVRDGVNITSKTLPLLYEFPKDIARDPLKWRDAANWPMVVPNNGRSITVERLQELFAEAESKGQDETTRWASQHLNIEVGVGIKSDHWSGARHWAKNADATLGLAEIIRRSDTICIGVDGGGLDDLLGAGVIGRDADTGDWLHWGCAWVHQDVLELRKEIAPALLDYAEDGDLTIAAAMAEAIAGLCELAEEVNASGKLAVIGLDPAGVKEIVDELARRGMTQDGEQVIGVRQGWTLAGTIKGVEGRLSDGRFRHCGQNLMAWSVGNAMTRMTGSNVTITKQASGVAKIDPLMALFDAADRMFALGDNARSVYEDRGFVVFG